MARIKVTCRVGRDGLIAMDPVTGYWYACSRRPGLSEWCARRDSLEQAEKAVADAHAGEVDPADRYVGEWPL